MKLFAHFAPLAALVTCLVGGASAQTIAIGYPPEGFSVSPNSSLTVQVDRPVRTPSPPFFFSPVVDAHSYLSAELPHRLTGGRHRHLPRALPIVERASLSRSDAAPRTHALLRALRPTVP